MDRIVCVTLLLVAIASEGYCQEIGPVEVIPASKAGTTIDPSYYEAPKALGVLAKKLSESKDFVEPEDKSLFHDWVGVAAFDGNQIVPMEGVTISILPDTYGEAIEERTANPVVVRNARWHYNGMLYWSELKSSPPAGQKSHVIGYAYIKIAGDSAVLSHFEFPVDPATYEFRSREQMYPAGITLVLKRSRQNKTTRFELVETLVKFEKQFEKQLVLYSPRACTVNGGFHLEYDRYLSRKMGKAKGSDD